MVKIRLARIGTKNRPCYRVVVTDVRNSRDGKFIERVGFLSMIAIKGSANKDIVLDLNRINHWVQRGAIVSNRVGFLIKYYKKKNVLLN